MVKKSTVTKSASRRLSKPQLDQFFISLSQTSNVAASARQAKLSVDMLYRKRRKDSAFAKRWHEALCEGYARLESSLLAEALTSASGNTSDATLKARAQRHRLALSLLSAHRSAVRGNSNASLQTKSAKPRARQQLLDKLEAIRAAMPTQASAPNSDAATAAATPVASVTNS